MLEIKITWLAACKVSTIPTVLYFQPHVVYSIVVVVVVGVYVYTEAHMGFQGSTTFKHVQVKKLASYTFSLAYLLIWGVGWCHN